MSLSLILPDISDFMDAAVIEWVGVSAGDAFRRGDALVRLLVEMEVEGDTLACPPSLTVELVAAEAGVLLEWNVDVGQKVRARTVLALAAPGDARTSSADRPLRCVARECLE